jgi:hypothetical protein
MAAFFVYAPSHRKARPQRSENCILQFMELPLSLTLFHHAYSDDFATIEPVPTLLVQQVFAWVQRQKLFDWQQNHNFCEARAEVVSLLLQAAKIPHAKAWVFGAAFLHKGYIGGLKNNWNYHVCVAIPIWQNDQIAWMVIDPSTRSEPVTLHDWATDITYFPHSYHFIRNAGYYIFPQAWMGQLPWHKRHHRNFRWAMQGLSGISSLSPAGKARLSFQKKRIAATTHQFMELRSECQQKGAAIFGSPM